MNGKLRKIALGMSVLMCAGMLFTCVMPAKARFKVCDHSTTHALLGFTDWQVVGNDNQGHYMEREELAGCGICGETFTLNKESKKEPHDFIEYDDDQGRPFMEYCRVCERINIYIYPSD